MSETNDIDLIDFSNQADATWTQNSDTKGVFANPAERQDIPLLEEKNRLTLSGSVSSSRYESISIEANVYECQNATQKIQSSIDVLKNELAKLEVFVNGIESNQSKSLNKAAYVELMKTEKDYFQHSAELYEKVNAYITMTYTSIMKQDEMMSKFL